MTHLITSFVVLMICGLEATGQKSTLEIASFLTKNKFSDGSTIKVQAVSYGVIHRIPFRHEEPEFFKSASPTIMLTTRRDAPTGHYLGHEGDLWTKAEAFGPTGSWYPLIRRTEPRALKEEEDEPTSYEGPPPVQMWETWEFPKCPQPSPWLRVRIWTTRNSSNLSSVVFQIPNEEAWRERNAKEQTNGFNPQKWLNSEMFRAAMEGNLEYVKDLLAQGADPNSRDMTGMSALAIASQDGQIEVVRYLLAHGAEVNAHSKDKATDRTALMAAASMGNPAIVRLLVERGADVNTRGELGWTALVWAANESDVESVKYLLSHGADPNTKDGTIKLVEKTDSTNRFEIIKILKNAEATH